MHGHIHVIVHTFVIIMTKKNDTHIYGHTHAEGTLSPFKLGPSMPHTLGMQVEDPFILLASASAMVPHQLQRRDFA